MALILPRGYTTHTAVAGYLGEDLSADQVALCQAYIATAEQFIDRYTRRGDPIAGTAGWLNDPIAGERYELANVGARIYLRCVPVASVERVLVRSHSVGDPGAVLVAGAEYELQDPRAGLVVFSSSYGTAAGYADYAGSAGFNEAGRLVGRGWSLYSFALISYTPRQPLPPDVSLAATILVAHWLEYSINPGYFGLASLTIADRKSILQTDGRGQRVLPAEALAILDGYRRLIL